jgi:hypothetical protein
MHETGQYTISDLGELFSVLRPTVYRTISRPNPLPTAALAHALGTLLAEVDGNPHRVAFPQLVGSEEARTSRLRVTLRVTA